MVEHVNNKWRQGFIKGAKEMREQHLTEELETSQRPDILEWLGHNESMMNDKEFFENFA